MNNSSIPNKFNKTPNKLSVLDIIKNNPEISRADIARQTNLTKPTISLIVDELISDQLVIESGVGESSNGGRKPTMLRFNSKAYSVIGINFSSGTSFDIAEVDLEGNIIKVTSTQLDLFIDPDLALKAVKEQIKDFFMKEVSNPSKVLGIGAGLPGYIDPLNGIAKFMFNFGWRNMDFSQQLYQTFHLPVFIDNEANALALAESILGSGRMYNNFIYIDISSGVGSGIIIDKKLYNGSKNSAGEVGHMIIDKNGPLCKCGKRGCLESLVAPYALKQRLNDITAAKKQKNVYANWTGENLSLTTIINEARNGDQVFQSILDEVCENLGIAISNLLNILNPEAIILGGDISETDEIIFSKLRTWCESISLFGEGIEIIPSSLGKYAGVLSSSSLVLRDFFTL